MIIYTEKLTPRLTYVIRFIFPPEEFPDVRVSVTFPSPEERRSELIINYSMQSMEGEYVYHIQPEGLLFEENIRTEWPSVSIHPQGFPVIFRNGGVPGFDIFSAVFYLISRMEEYYIEKRDEMGRLRYDATLAWKNNFLNRPLVDEWIEWLYQDLQKTGFCYVLTRKYQLKPTFDVDTMFAYKAKPIVPLVLSILNGLRKGDIWYRLACGLDCQKDPFDNFDEILQTLRDRDLSFLIFFHVGDYVRPHDRSSSYKCRVVQKVIKKMASAGEVGLHPSLLAAEDENVLRKEKERLESILQKKVTKVRQHFLKWRIPHSVQRLIKAGFTDDYTMGYAPVSGFRASTSRSFYFFDLTCNKELPYKIHPFCWMDATYLYYQKKSKEAVLSEIHSLVEKIRRINGTFSFIYHNETLYNKGIYQGFKDIYLHLLQLT